MEILLAREAGFCFGVKRAIDMSMKTRDKGIDFSTFGELIHNKQVVKSLEDLGINAVESLEDAKGSTVLIRSHGVAKHIYEEAKAKGIKTIDGTCPYVKKIQNLAARHSAEGFDVIIVGDRLHPEVIGVSGWSTGPVHVVYSVEEAEALPQLEKAIIVSQATLTMKKWETILEVVKTKVSNLIEENTICEATRERQSSAEELSQEVDMMIVIGGKHSSNTIKLLEVCKRHCKNSYHIETKDEIQSLNFANCDKIGITAGASTPDYIINEVIHALKNMH